MSTPRRGVRRALASAAMLATGAALLAVAHAEADAQRRGNTFRVGALDFDSVDPAKAWTLESWDAQSLTCVRLLNYPDRALPYGLRLVPQGATDFRVSRDGRTYTFRIRKGYRFSNGRPLTARNFAYAINRVLNPTMRSPAADYYIPDIVGADAVRARRAQSASGVSVRGDRLVIRLVRPRGDFLARISASFFCAVPLDLPVDPEGVGAPIHAAGPYYAARYVRGREVVLERNRFYRGKRNQSIDRFVWDLSGSFQEKVARVERGELDSVDVPGITGDLRVLMRRRYGVNRSRFFVTPSFGLYHFAFNTSRPLFRNNPKLRRAVNLAIDRRAMAREHGPLFGYLTDQLLPPRMPGFRNEHLYPLTGPRLARAKALARGNLRGKKAVLYTNPSGAPLAIGHILAANLKRIGLDVDVRGVGGRVRRLATPGEPWDIGWSVWYPDWPDPYQYVNVLFHGREIGDGFNITRLNSRRFNRLMDQAARLTGRARYRAYGRLDVTLMSMEAPVAPYAFDTSGVLVSKRVGCKVLNPSLDLGAVCLR